MREKRIGEGVFVRYKIKNELGLVKEITNNGTRCWYHTGGTTTMTPFHMIEVMKLEEVLTNTFSNEYAKASLLERSFRILLEEDKDVDDLIDERHIRQEVKDLIGGENEIKNE